MSLEYLQIELVCIRLQANSSASYSVFYLSGGIKDNIVDLIIRIFVSQLHLPNSLIFLVNIN